MFGRNKVNPGYVDAIDTALSELKGFEAHTEEYAQAVDQIVKLHALTQTQQDKRDRRNYDALITGACSLLGILVIVGYEEGSVLTSKALGFIPKIR